MSMIAIDTEVRYTTIRLIQKLRATTAPWCHAAADKIEQHDHEITALKDEIIELKQQKRKLEQRMANVGYWEQLRNLHKEERQQVRTNARKKLHLLKELVADAFAIEVSELKSRSRERYLVNPRHLYCMLARELVTDATVLQIGTTIARDHTTVLYGIQAASNWTSTEGVMKEKANAIRKEWQKIQWAKEQEAQL